MSRPSLFAVAHVRKMRGGSQAHLLRASDGNLYVTKFQNNPGGIRTLASEFLATNLALSLALPMAEVQVIDVPESLIAGSPALQIDIHGKVFRCVSGPQFGSCYTADPATDRVFDYMPQSQFHRVANRLDLIRMLAFDKWTGNCDGRQTVFTKRAGETGYRMTCIDQHYCFNGERWTFPDLPLMGTYFRNQVYEDVTGWESFEPILTQIEEIEYHDLWRSAAQIPYDWYEYDGEGLFQLVEMLYRRRSWVRNLITEFRNSMRRPFPNWQQSAPKPGNSETAVTSNISHS